MLKSSSTIRFVRFITLLVTTLLIVGCTPLSYIDTTLEATSPAYPPPAQTEVLPTVNPEPYPPPSEPRQTPEPPSVFISPPTSLPLSFTPQPPIISTATIYEITNTLDLSPTLPLEQKSEIVVLLQDGSYVMLLVPPNFRVSDLPLQEGDVIVQISSPTADFGKNPFPPIATATSSVRP